MIGRVIHRALAALVITGALALGAAGCGDDEAGGSCDVPAPAGSLPYDTTSCEDAECSTGRCFSFTQKGKKCTKACASDADCAGLVPAGGTAKCGGQGVCQVS